MNKKIYEVTNRSFSNVCYSITEDNIRREFTPGETKRISYEELEKLSYQPGGKVLLSDYLLIKASEALDNLELAVEPEYNMEAKDVEQLLVSGSLDSFLDCLDFAPEGVLQLVKEISVRLPLNDVAKREAIKEKMGFDVSAAIANIQAEKAAELAEKGEAAESKSKQRRVQPEEKPAGRRTTPNYKVVSEE